MGVADGTYETDFDEKSESPGQNPAKFNGSSNSSEGLVWALIYKTRSSMPSTRWATISFCASSPSTRASTADNS